MQMILDDTNSKEVYVAFEDSLDAVTTFSSRASYTMETYPWQFKNLFVYASDDPYMYKGGTYEEQINSSQWVSLANYAIAVYMDTVTSGAWSIASLFGVTDWATIASPNYGGRTVIDSSCTWTRRYRMVYSEYDACWVIGYSTEYAKWSDTVSVRYYDPAINNENSKTTQRSGTVYSKNYYNSSYIDSMAKTNFWYGTVGYDTVGNHSVKYNGKTVITLREDF